MIDVGQTIGVLGGMGPDATVDFMAKVIALTPAARDQDHVRMLVDHNPRVP
ncbi:MAG: aspartate racemase, partial [Gammaproteobacteria bacterium]|nr:aspartate racemase [Gammaproteobacteria bacterium]